MVEHYVRRHHEWAQVLSEMRGVDAHNTRTLYASALLCPITSLRRLDGFEPPALLRDSTLNVRGVGTFVVRAGTDDIIAILPSREPQVQHEVETRLKPGDTFVDAGANIGLYSIIASRIVGDVGRVIAIEMMPPTAARLRMHVDMNGASVEVVERALSDTDDQVIVATSTPDKFGQASIVVGTGDDRRTVRHSVETIRLDTALAGVDRIALMKMDLEGAELSALRGAPETLRRTDALLFECNDRDKRVFALLRDSGFSITSLDENDFLALRSRAPEEVVGR